MKSNSPVKIIAVMGVCLACLAAWITMHPADKSQSSHPQRVAAPKPLPPAPKPVVQREAPPPEPTPLPTSKGSKPALQNPAARVALSLVGAELTAEMVWTQAINDPKLPKHERQDLIEDLNEVGYTNLQRPTPADLELIKARVEIIDRLASEALDKTNADAFMEARKDLTQMLVKAGQ